MVPPIGAACAGPAKVRATVAAPTKYPSFFILNTPTDQEKHVPKRLQSPCQNWVLCFFNELAESPPEIAERNVKNFDTLPRPVQANSGQGDAFFLASYCYKMIFTNIQHLR
jgi:hypothetical protein